MKILLLLLLITSMGFTQTWSSVGGGCVKQGGAGIYQIKIIDNLLYVSGGGFTTDGNIAFWNGKIWNSYISDKGCGVFHAFDKYNDKLYIGGNFYCLNNWNENLEKIAYWNTLENKWFAVGTSSYPPTGGDVNLFQIYKGKLYVGGNFMTIGGNSSMSFIASWDDKKYDFLGDAQQYYGVGGVKDMCVFNDKLIVAGDFINEKGINNLGAYNGTYWTKLNNKDFPNSTKAVFTDEINKGLYVSFFEVDGTIVTPFTVRLNDTENHWDTIYHTDKNGEITFGTANAYAIYNNNLYAVCNDRDYAKNYTFARFDGYEWQPIVGPEGNVYDIKVWNDTLYLGGSFKNVNGDTSMAYLAAYYDTTRGHLDEVGLGVTEIEKDKYNLSIFPNPSKNKATISYNLPIGEKGEIKIYSINGVLVQEHKLEFGANTLEIKTTKWKPGTYIYSLQIEGKVLESKKMVVN